MAMKKLVNSFIVCLKVKEKKEMKTFFPFFVAATVALDLDVSFAFTWKSTLLPFFVVIHRSQGNSPCNNIM